MQKLFKIFIALGFMMMLGTVVYAAWTLDWTGTFNASVFNGGQEWIQNFTFSDITLNTTLGPATNTSKAELSLFESQTDVLFEIEENWTLWEGACDATGDCTLVHGFNGGVITNGTVMNMSAGPIYLNTTITCVKQSCGGSWEVTWNFS